MWALTWGNRPRSGFDLPTGVTTRMPRPSHPSRRPAWTGTGDAWNWVADLITATGVWAAVGFGLDRWLGTWPVLFVIGAIVGHATGIYILWRKAKEMGARIARDRGADGERD